MKRLLLASVFVTLLVASCSTKSTSKKYNSYREAKQACKEWVEKGGNYELKNPKFVVNNQYLKDNVSSKLELGFVFEEAIYRIPLRWCDEEKETRQVLGLRIPEIKKDDRKIYLERCWGSYCDEIDKWQMKNSKVEANFYF